MVICQKSILSSASKYKVKCLWKSKKKSFFLYLCFERNFLNICILFDVNLLFPLGFVMRLCNGYIIVFVPCWPGSFTKMCWLFSVNTFFFSFFSILSKYILIILNKLTKIIDVFLLLYLSPLKVCTKYYSSNNIFYCL